MEKKKIRVLDEYYNMKEKIKVLVTDRRLDQYAEDIYDWALNDPDALKVTQFYLERGISRENWNRWMDMHEGLSKAYNTAIHLIGNRRESGAVKRKFAEGIVSSTMHRYDPEWRESEEWRATLRQEKPEENKKTFIVVESFDEPKQTPEEVAQKARKSVGMGGPGRRPRLIKPKKSS